jgi:hypothetical protein
MYHNKWGKYSHDDMIGRKYGSKASIIALSGNFANVLNDTVLYDTVLGNR